MVRGSQGCHTAARGGLTDDVVDAFERALPLLPELEQLLPDMPAAACRGGGGGGDFELRARRALCKPVARALPHEEVVRLLAFVRGEVGHIHDAAHACGVAGDNGQAEILALRARPRISRKVLIHNGLTGAR